MIQETSPNLLFFKSFPVLIVNLPFFDFVIPPTVLSVSEFFCALFKVLYFLHKIITFLATFNWISFGNYSSFVSKNITSILKNDKSWLAFSSCLAFNCSLKRLYAPRKNRLIGKSKLSLRGLVNHALRVNAVFLTRISLVFFLYISSFHMLNKNFALSEYLMIFLLVLFYFMIFFTYQNNNQKKFKDSLNYIETVEKF